jgi:NADPH-dependent 2,4-dienoyl-CoA reductase/sulfur reductase-like enzyme
MLVDFDLMEGNMEYRKTVSVHSEWDVVVCGAGASGICAAIAAARLGMRVMLVERYGAVGGSLTLGNVTTIMGDVAKGSIRDEIARLLKSPNPSTGVDNDDAKGKLTALLDEAGVNFRLQTPVVDAYVEDGEIKGVFVLTQKGMMLIKGKRVIDATGDGFVSFLAGCDVMVGRDEDGLVQPCPLCTPLTESMKT